MGPALRNLSLARPPRAGRSINHSSWQLFRLFFSTLHTYQGELFCLTHSRRSEMWWLPEEGRHTVFQLWVFSRSNQISPERPLVEGVRVCVCGCVCVMHPVLTGALACLEMYFRKLAHVLQCVTSVEGSYDHHYTHHQHTLLCVEFEVCRADRQAWDSRVDFMVLR